jgi:hypothetical protein
MLRRLLFIARRDFPEFEAEEAESLTTQYMAMDAGMEGKITTQNLRNYMRSSMGLMEESTLDTIIASADEDRNGTVDFSEFMSLIRRIRGGLADEQVSKYFLRFLNQQNKTLHLFRRVVGRPSVDNAFITLQLKTSAAYVMIDNKANTLISVCALVLSFAFGQILSTGGSYTLIAFSIATFAALVCSVLSVMPHTASRTKKEVGQEKTSHYNIMFFEHASQVPLDVYMEAMSHLFEKDQKLYMDLCRDIYLFGYALGRSKSIWLRRYLDSDFGFWIRNWNAKKFIFFLKKKKKNLSIFFLVSIDSLISIDI